MKTMDKRVSRLIALCMALLLASGLSACGGGGGGGTTAEPAPPPVADGGDTGDASGDESGDDGLNQTLLS